MQNDAFLSRYAITGQLAKLCSYMTIKTFNPNAVVFRQHQAGTEFYYLYEGRVKLFSESSTSYVAKGESFGERALLLGHARGETAKGRQVITDYWQSIEV